MTTDSLPLLEVRGLGKRLTPNLQRARRYGIDDITRELNPFAPVDRTLRPEEFWALHDVSFEVQPGEAMGIIGQNGAGKSTLLRVLHGITRPDAGSAVLRGTHAALLDLGAPFNRLLSGRENIVTAAALHGVARDQTDDLIEAVADFSELGSVLDAPMWSFSAGMMMRLGFAIAVQVHADLLLIDEVIAVGDLSFQRKCMSHIRTHLADGGSLVLVSHDLWMVQTLCQRALVLSEGTVITSGTTNRAISSYLRDGRARQTFIPRNRTGDESADLGTDSAVVEVEGYTTPDGFDPVPNGPISFEIEARAADGPLSANWHIDVLTANQQVCVIRLLQPENSPSVALGTDPQRFTCELPALPLMPGTYFLAVHLTDPKTGTNIGSSAQPTSLEVGTKDERIETLAQFAGAFSTLDTTYEVSTA